MRPSLFRAIFFAILTTLAFSAFVFHASDAVAQADAGEDAPSFVQPIQTDSPRQTIESFQRLTQLFDERLQAYFIISSKANFEAVESLVPSFHALIDLSEVAPSARYDVGMDTLGYLLDILGRIEPLSLDEIPGIEAVEAGEVDSSWRIPKTRLQIVRIAEGEREGEFLFSARTVTVAPRFFERIEHLPLRTSLRFESWTRGIPQVTGPAIPSWIPANMPKSLLKPWLQTPIWKVIAVFVLAVLAAGLLYTVRLLVNRYAPDSMISGPLLGSLTPIAALVFLYWLSNFVTLQINVAGLFATIVEASITVLQYLAAAWVVWLLIFAFFAWIIRARRIEENSFDAHLWRLAGKVLGIAAVVIILANAAHFLGLPLYSVVAGLGIGGLAVALAIRPTLENMIGGLILYTDQPVRVGDFCSFGDKTGTVESIGIRSTKLRALDRTIITVPNAALADMHLINYARCDRMLILSTFGLRYETQPDQLRYTLAKIREMLHAHPRIDSDTIRVRFHEYGDSSLDIQMRVYALTRDWNDFFAVKEDLLLRINDIVRGAGTGFAFPSQTLYLGRDSGLDQQSGDAAVRAVQAWRRGGKLPFPRLSRDRIDELRETLDYPPRGSVEAGGLDEAWEEFAEPLSADEPEELEEEEEDVKEEKKKDTPDTKS